MPANDVQWAMFLFFAIGSLGGLMYMVSLVLDLVRTIHIARRAGRRK